MSTPIGFFSGSSVGYFIGYLFGGPRTGAQGLVDSLILSLGTWQLHLHHWLLSLLFLAFLFFFIRKKFQLPALVFTFFIGFFSGLLAHGIIAYDDWNRILFRIN